MARKHGEHEEPDDDLAELVSAPDEDLDDVPLDLEDDDEVDPDDSDDSEDGEPAEEEEGAGQTGRKTAQKAAKVEHDPDAELQFADTRVATEKELRKAMEWAFEGEDEISSELLDIFAGHARMVLEGNKRMNLTAIVDPKEMAAKHYLDSWRATRLLPLLGRRVLDLGCGAGFPGLPIAMGEPHANVLLLDSTKKRIDFVSECIEALGVPNLRAEWARGEEHLTRHAYDIVVMRAISSVRENVRLLRKVRHSHKDLVMLKGSSWSREVRAGEREAERLGFRLDTVWEHELPGEMGSRAILVYRAPGGHGE